MEPADADEGEPAARLLLSRILVFSWLLLMAACETAPDKPALQSRTPESWGRTAGRLPVLIQRTRQPKKFIYLTFDDGPNRGTRAVYETFRALQAPVSFFIVGQHVSDSREQRQLFETLAADSTVEICNHSFSHAGNRYNRFYEDSNGVVADFRKADSLLRPPSRIVRMPGRNAWRLGRIRVTDVTESKAAIDAVAHAGFQVMGWDIEWTFNHKSMAPDADTGLLLRRIYNLLESDKTHTPGHLVLLAHDQAFRDSAYLPLLQGFVQSLRQQENWELVLASRYPGLQ